MRPIFRNESGQIRGIWMMLAYSVISVAFFRFFLEWAVFKFVALDESKSMYQQPLLQCLFMWPALGFTIFLGRVFAKSQGHGWDYMGLRINRAWFRQLLTGFGIGTTVLLGIIAAYRVFGLARFAWNPDAVYGSVVWGVYWCLMVGLFEESDYRGYFLRKGSESIGVWPALLLQAVWFAGAHFANPGHSSRLVFALALFNTFFYAVMAGVAVRKTGSIAFVVGFHAAWNWSSGYAAGFALSGYERKSTYLFRIALNEKRPDWLTGGAYGPEASVLWTVLIAACLFYFVRLDQVSSPSAITGSESAT